MFSYCPSSRHGLASRRAKRELLEDGSYASMLEVPDRVYGIHTVGGTLDEPVICECPDPDAPVPPTSKVRGRKGMEGGEEEEMEGIQILMTRPITTSGLILGLSAQGCQIALRPKGGRL